MRQNREPLADPYARMAPRDQSIQILWEQAVQNNNNRFLPSLQAFVDALLMAPNQTRKILNVLFLARTLKAEDQNSRLLVLNGMDEYVVCQRLKQAIAMRYDQLDSVFRQTAPYAFNLFGKPQDPAEIVSQTLILDENQEQQSSWSDEPVQ